jgi:hypothetical protein
MARERKEPTLVASLPSLATFQAVHAAHETAQGETPAERSTDLDQAARHIHQLQGSGTQLPLMRLAQTEFGLRLHTTLWCRVMNKNKYSSHNNTVERHWIISSGAIWALLGWLILLGRRAQPLTLKLLCQLVALLTGMNPPGKWWFYAFHKKHWKVIKTTSSRGLNPARAKVSRVASFSLTQSGWLQLQCFNKTAIEKQFCEFEELACGMKPANLFNMDEVGMQCGEGWKRSGQLYIYAADNTNHYRL